MPRKILHLDLDAFFCAVEENLDPSLRGKAFAVGGRPDARGVVAACSYAARVYGVHSAMPMAQAMHLCPDLIIRPNRRGVYGETSRDVMAILHDLTPLVEQLSIDEAFLDVTMHADSAADLARKLQGRINAELKLPCSLGVASNKLVAKIANTVGKAKARSGVPPNAITVVPPGDEATFLAPLPATELWGVGPKTAEQLKRLGITTIGEIARWPETDLIRRFGQHGRDLARHARGLDVRPVETERDAKSISQETTFTRDVSDRTTLTHTLRRLADGVGRQVRKEGLAGTTIKLKLRWSDFTTLTRQLTLKHTTDGDNEIYAVAEHLLDQHWPRGKPVRLIGVGVSGFAAPRRQLSLWESAGSLDEERRLQDTLDDLRDRFGGDAIRRASDLDETESE
jgi:DNA polymerase-4